MANLERTDSLTKLGFTPADQEIVVNKASAESSEALSQLFHTARKSEKFQQPHNWYASADKTYGLPHDSGANNIEMHLRSGWRRQSHGQFPID